jgi:hypothetical protein
MNGVTDRVVIDNTSVIVACGSGPDAQIAPEMQAFARIYGTAFVPHRIGHADRKAGIERTFSYVERNFLAGRTFIDWDDLNTQALDWCKGKANKKLKRSLGMSPDEAYLMEKPYLKPLPPYLPPIYETVHRVVDVAGYINLDTNRYSVPERLIGKEVEVHKHAEKVVVVFNHQEVASHPRLIGKREAHVTHPSHHGPLFRTGCIEVLLQRKRRSSENRRSWTTMWLRSRNDPPVAGSQSSEGYSVSNGHIRESRFTRLWQGLLRTVFMTSPAWRR